MSSSLRSDLQLQVQIERLSSLRGGGLVQPVILYSLSPFLCHQPSEASRKGMRNTGTPTFPQPRCH